MIDAEPSIVKDGWSSHGLGHLLHANKKDDEDELIRDKWEEQLWIRIIECANSELSEDELCEMYSGDYAVSKYAVTTPNLHRRLREINRQKKVAKQVKPFNFVLIGQRSRRDRGDRGSRRVRSFEEQEREEQEREEARSDL